MIHQRIIIQSKLQAWYAAIDRKLAKEKQQTAVIKNLRERGIDERSIAGEDELAATTKTKTA